MTISLKHRASFIRETWTTLNKNWVINISMKLSFILIAVQCIAFFVVWKKLPPMVPLWYSLPWGDEQLEKSFWLVILPVGSFIWQIAAILTSVYSTREHLIFAQILSLTSFVVSLFSCVVILSIISLVT